MTYFLHSIAKKEISRRGVFIRSIEQQKRNKLLQSLKMNLCWIEILCKFYTGKRAFSVRCFKFSSSFNQVFKGNPAHFDTINVLLTNNLLWLHMVTYFLLSKDSLTASVHQLFSSSGKLPRPLICVIAILL